ncbi:MAG: hypothetical protein DRN81_01275 [Thermoproteota archaeon]|nr:MAG: hypothetical protein DRN81_01275 [Candidatus Korarchaeota archaeon]
MPVHGFQITKNERLIVKKIEIVQYDPEFCPEEKETLEEHLLDERLMPDDQIYTATKKEFLELDPFSDDDYFDVEDEDEVEQASYYASMLERIRELNDDDVIRVEF